MTTTTDNCEEYSNSDFLTILESQPQLYDLHTHLLGMGNVGFWIDTILNDKKIMPTNEKFRKDKQVRRDLCRLIWDKRHEKSGFINGETAAQFIEFLIKKNFLPWITPEGKAEVKLAIEEKFTELFSTFEDLVGDEMLNEELRHRGLNFKDDFSYDVVLTLSDLAKGLGISDTGDDDISQMKIADKLGIYLSQDTKSIQFRHRIVFDARIQKFKVFNGILVDELRKLITIDVHAPNEAKKIARAHIINAFSMCDAQGTSARYVDLHNFRGAFTPEFYPRRFALKDSIYSQRLDVLAALINYVLKRYQVCLPPVKYCEFSIGVGDLCRPWVFDVLCSFPSRQHLEAIRKNAESPNGNSDIGRVSSSGTGTEDVHEGQSYPTGMEPYGTYVATENLNSFSQCVRDKHFPYLKVACNASGEQGSIVPSTPNVTYKFLAGFDRTNIDSSLVKNQNDARDNTNVQSSLLKNQNDARDNINVQSSFLKKQNDALHFLNDSPQLAILLMLKEIKNSQDEVKKSELFKKNLEKLTDLQKTAEKTPWFYDWVVGLDLFGDELGYPYCPFVAYPFIKHIQDIRKKEIHGTTKDKKYPYFGVRVHCGENVQFADDNVPAYRSFIAHMYIVFCSLRFLRYKLQYGIRIGHGIAFERILGDTMSSSMHRKSAVLRAEMRHQAPQLFENIAFEVNITSNEYLLGDSLRQGNYAQTHCLEALLKLKAPIILATDDDGIWPIDHCLSVHPGHHSLAAEYCRAISSSLFTKPDDLKAILVNTKNFCFSNMGGELPKSRYDLPKGTTSMNAVIIHPDLVKHILRRLNDLHRSAKIDELQKRRRSKKEHVVLFKEAVSNDVQSRELERIHQIQEEENRLLEEICGSNGKAVRSGPFYKEYNSYYPNLLDDYTIEDEIMWNKEYRSIAQVAYVCSYDKDNLINEVEVPIDEEYHILFKCDKEEKIFKYIHRYWKLIHDQFMKNDDNLTKYKYVLICPPNTSSDNNQASSGTQGHECAFVSPPSNKRNPFSGDNFGIDFAIPQQGRKIEIRVYPGHAPIPEAKNRWRDALKTHGLEHISVVMYTNNDKNKFTYIESGESLQLQVNPQSDRRDKNKKQFLYALCPHAGAATAALHFIADSFHSLKVQGFISKRDNSDEPQNQIQVNELITSEDSSLKNLIVAD